MSCLHASSSRFHHLVLLILFLKDVLGNSPIHATTVTRLSSHHMSPQLDPFKDVSYSKIIVFLKII